MSFGRQCSLTMNHPAPQSQYGVTFWGFTVISSLPCCSSMKRKRDGFFLLEPFLQHCRRGSHDGRGVVGFHHGTGKQQQCGASPWWDTEDEDSFPSLVQTQKRERKLSAIQPEGSSWEVLPELEVKQLDVNIQSMIKV